MIIDCHHHAFPPSAPVKPWNQTNDQKRMDQAGIDRVLLSCPLPVHSSNMKEMNDFLLKQKSDHYDILGSLCFDDNNSAILEIQRIKEEVVGFQINTHADDTYLSDDCLNPLFDYLNEIHAVLVVHPNHFRAPKNQKVVFEGNDSVYEYTFDTARAIFDLILKDKVRKWKNLKWVLPHAGGTIPFLAHRVSVSGSWGCIKRSEEEIMKDLKSFYYDLALNYCDENLHFMKEFVGAEHLLYGMDYPNSGDELLDRDLALLTKPSLFNDEERELILYKNAQKIFYHQ